MDNQWPLEDDGLKIDRGEIHQMVVFRCPVLR